SQLAERWQRANSVRTLDLMEKTDMQQFRRSSEPQPVAAASINLSAGSRKPAEMNEMLLIQQLKSLK
ncbi:hypothetical protein BOX15_Mlig021599g1, partial [Macrostomum lignano]